MSNDDFQRICVCICTRNRPDDLNTALQSLWGSTLLPAQVIVSDDSDAAQSDKTRAVCAAQPHPVDYVPGPRLGLSANRNCCIDNLRDDIAGVSYIDDDVKVVPEFLPTFANVLAEVRGKAVITGGQLDHGTYLLQPRNRSFWGHQEVVPRDGNDYRAIVINTTLFPRQLFRTERFDEALRYGSEEVDMAERAVYAGFPIRFVPEVNNLHYPSPTNRKEYESFTEASRLYSQYKYLRYVKKSPKEAVRFRLLAPFHHVFSFVKQGKWGMLPKAFAAIARANEHTRNYEAAHKE
ncbi:MAG: glycosyltransferase family 2 protein [Armatimonadetes bacterium]|nr:glycosyltransferase family 2 protein [Armatimonadota bacterium]